jgi:cytochrome c oxidase subunit 2
LAFLAYRGWTQLNEPELIPIASQGPPRGRTLEQWGVDLFDSHGCAACHSVAGVRGVGGSLDGIMGQTRHFTDGSDGVVDETYLRESIVVPQRHVVMGFASVMPRFDFRENEVDALVAYIMSL